MKFTASFQIIVILACQNRAKNMKPKKLNCKLLFSHAIDFLNHLLFSGLDVMSNANFLAFMTRQRNKTWIESGSID